MRETNGRRQAGWTALCVATVVGSALPIQALTASAAGAHDLLCTLTANNPAYIASRGTMTGASGISSCVGDPPEFLTAHVGASINHKVTGGWVQVGTPDSDTCTATDFCYAFPSKGGCAPGETYRTQVSASVTSVDFVSATKAANSGGAVPC
jgi:hypothetical protein